jgi:TIGR03009 family protein
MRYRWLSLTCVLLCSVAAVAQQPPAVTLDPQNNKLDAVLVNWEKAMGGLTSFHAQVNRTGVDKVYGTVATYAGEAKYLKPNRIGLWLVNTKKDTDFERILLNGQTAYKWEPTKKEIQIHTLPKMETLESMLLGIKALDAKKRYDLKLLDDPTPPPAGQPPYYYYIQVLPKDEQDKAEFSRARLVLTASTFLPRQIWFEAANGNETTWDFPKLATNLKIEAGEFEQPIPPKGWELRKIPPPEPKVRAIDGK